MVAPAEIPRVVADAARLVRKGELVVFGSASLAFYLEDAPTTRDMDLWCDPPERGEVVEALMGELSWYHERHGAYVEVWAPETFRAPSGWRTRARQQELTDLPGLTLLVVHPHDVLFVLFVLFAKLEHMDERDIDHMKRILDELPMSSERFEALSQTGPPHHRRDLGRVEAPEVSPRTGSPPARADETRRVARTPAGASPVM